MPATPTRPLAAITGASAGIGLVFAQKLAPTHDLLLIARREDRLQQIAVDLAAQHGTHVEILPANLASQTGLDTVAARLRAAPNLALLVNNAGFGLSGKVWETSLPDQLQMHQLHVMATLALSHAALANMVPRGDGAIINVASVAGFIVGARSVSYGATKAWMIAFTQGLYYDLYAARSRVSVQALCPGYTFSEFHDLMQQDRTRIAGPAWWLTADRVVQTSLDALPTRKLLVVPGWRYKLVVALFPRLPLALRTFALKQLTPKR